MWHRLERKKVTIEEIPDNKLYSLDNSSLYIKKADKKLYIYRRLRADKLLDHYELISVEKNLFAIEPLMQSAIIIDEDCDLDFKANFFYVLLQYANQQVCIKELLSQRIVLKVNDEKDCKIVGKRNLYRWDGKTRFESKDVEDIIIRLWNADCKNIAFYSIRKGYIFGPYNYSKIDNYYHGVKLDEKYLVDNGGFVLDITDYEIIHANLYEVYYNEKRQECYILLNNNCLLEEMFIVEKDPDDKYYDKIFELKVGDNEYSFNAETKELYVDECYTADDWTDEDAWDAMTDGQYGDYPGSGWDMEMFGH